MRLFLAINPPDDVRERIGEAIAPLRAAAPDLRWLDAERLHLTVRFLGEQPTDRVPQICAAIDNATARHADTPLSFGGVGAFPSFRRARVVWLAVEPHPRLELLHHDVEEACVTLGFEAEGRPFRPHVTIARVPDGTSEEPLRALARAARQVRVAEVVDVTSVDLMASGLTPAGPRYELLHTSSLRPAARAASQ